MENLYVEFLTALRKQDKETAMKICMQELENGNIDIISLYEKILTEALNSVEEEFEDEDILIWQEHVRSAIILSIIENCYRYVLKERTKLGLEKKGKVMVLCPKYEDHIIGARMATDIFTIAGYQTTFIGADTPCRAVLKAIETIRPDIISISVTNFYNIIETKRTIDMIKNHFNYGIKFILGGDAFRKSKDMYKEIGGDIYLESLQDIFS
ncbi:cobalamin B12-binding domain-containing protein [Tissierella creatinophila]|uniref:B12 binding domain protein n=1 Tax=Tissierella creatinophila DSM 6911 TaxID=1123403 RepID=A0A1U7M854_TISCR|nr:cobalamin-dependent protein [Tissierella creatinophila]OLS03466.1 B12 binding domain protein [Tissierella creatinophila DSM 6911]